MVPKQCTAKNISHYSSDAPLDVSEISLYEEAENTWELGKKIGLYVENDDDIVETLVQKAKESFEETPRNKAKSKRRRKKSIYKEEIWLERVL